MSIVAEGSADALAGPAIIIARDGAERVVETNASLICDSANEKVGVVLVFRDVTERLRAEDERRKNEKLESLGVAAGGIAHDFNNLLTAIGKCLDCLMSAKPGEQATERLVAKSLVRAQELAQQLLTFAKGGLHQRLPIDSSYAIRSFSLHGSMCARLQHSGDLWPADVIKARSARSFKTSPSMPTRPCRRVERFGSSGNLELASTPRFDSKRALPAHHRARRGIVFPGEKEDFRSILHHEAEGQRPWTRHQLFDCQNHGGMIEVASQPGMAQPSIFLPASDKPTV
jgi:hypothetical protein